MYKINNIKPTELKVKSKIVRSKMSSVNVNVKMNKKFLEGIEKCASLYGFKVEDAIAKIMESKKKVKIVAPKSKFVLPFSGERNEKCCEGLRYNEGLYTQCEVVKKGENKYCAVCEKGNLKYGTIDDRMIRGIMDYKDPSGKSPVHYGKIMKKLKITRLDVEEEGKRMGILVDVVHFEEQEEKRGRPKAVKVVKEKSEKKKGRPKKEPKGLELESKTTDLFASLIANSVSNDIDDMCEAEFVKNSEENGVKKIVVSEAEVLSSLIVDEKKKISKEEAKALKEQEKALEKAKKEEEKALEKALKEQEKALEKAKKEEEKAQAKALKEQEKINKELEKQQKQAIAEIKKENKETMKVESKKVPKEKVVKEEKVEEEDADIVKKIKYEGVVYLKSKKSGIIYNMEQDVIGKWDESSQKIIFNPVDAELEEDECESDSE
jgi:hypothetical protein